MNKNIIFIIILFLGFGCAGKKYSPLEKQEKILWTKLQADKNKPLPIAFETSSSINYFSENQNNRILATLWGNINGPIMLNIQAGLGKTIALIQEKQKKWLIYYLLSKTAYQGANTEATRSHLLGMSMPFDLQSLSFILLGRPEQIIGSDYTQAKMNQDGNWIYSLPLSAKVQEVVLDQEGKILALGNNNWKLSFSNWEQMPTVKQEIARKIKLKTSQGLAIIRLKKFDLRPKTWPQNATRLDLPDKTPILSL